MASVIRSLACLVDVFGYTWGRSMMRDVTAKMNGGSPCAHMKRSRPLNRAQPVDTPGSIARSMLGLQMGTTADDTAPEPLIIRLDPPGTLHTYPGFAVFPFHIVEVFTEEVLTLGHDLPVELRIRHQIQTLHPVTFIVRHEITLQSHLTYGLS